MNFNKSILEAAAIEWFGVLRYAVGHRPQLAPGEHTEDTLTPAIPSRTIATLRGPATGRLLELLSGVAGEGAWEDPK